MPSDFQEWLLLPWGAKSVTSRNGEMRDDDDRIEFLAVDMMRSKGTGVEGSWYGGAGRSVARAVEGRRFHRLDDPSILPPLLHP